MEKVRRWADRCLELERYGMAPHAAGEAAFREATDPGNPPPLDAVLDTSPVPGHEAQPPRPTTPPTFGLTAAGHVVALSGRTEADEWRDPVRLVAGEGWPDWYPATEGE
jgi:hypothetical protein